MTDSRNEIPTTIGADAVFKGELRFEKGLQLLGRFEGQINSSGQLIVGDGATLHGDVRAGTIRVDGNVKGNLHAESKVQLTASAKLEGDVHAARMEVAEGAVLVGHCVVGVDAHGKAAGQIKSAPAEVVAAPAREKPAPASSVPAKK